MKKDEIVNHVVRHTDLTKTAAQEAVEQVFQCMTDCLKKGESIYLRGFATFKPGMSKPRRGYDFSGSGKAFIIPARRTVKMILSKNMKEM